MNYENLELQRLDKEVLEPLQCLYRHANWVNIYPPSLIV